MQKNVKDRWPCLFTPMLAWKQEKATRFDGGFAATAMVVDAGFAATAMGAVVIRVS